MVCLNLYDYILYNNNTCIIVETFMSNKKLKSLGMPIYHGSGSHTHENTKYRFLVIDKFGLDIWKTFLKNGKKFNPAAVYKIGIQIVNIT